MKLRSRLCLLAAVALVPLVIFSAFAADQLIDALKSAALRGIRETARTCVLIIDREVKSSLSALRVLATSDSLKSGHWSKFYDQAKFATDPAGGWVVLYDEHGGQIINTRVSFGSQLPTRPSPGKIVEILDRGTPHVSGLVWGKTIQRHIVFVDMPVYMDNGKRYLLSKAFYAEYFNTAFANRNIPDDWVVGIFDRDGLTIARSKRAEEFVGKPASPMTAAAVKAGSETELKHLTRDNIEVYDSIVHSTLSGWTVAVGVPVQDVDAEFKKAGYLAAGGLLLAIMMAVLASAWIGRRLAQGIESAAESAGALGRNEVVPPSPPSGIDEIDHLQRALTGASQLLSEEQKRRAAAEQEKARLLESEQQARKLSDEQNRAKDEFMAMLGHELRNPLNAISSASSLLDMKGSNQERAKAVIRRQSDHLRAVIDDLLDLSRVIYGKVTLEKSVIDLGQLVQRCTDTASMTGALNGYQLSVHTESAPITADPTRIEQIVTNLLDNAIKYAPNGSHVDITVVNEGDEAVFRITDSGIGIRPDLLPRIFDVFVQGDNSLARVKGGMGIGLSLVRKLVELHGGSIRATSDGEGRGATFTVRLPRATEDVAGGAIMKKNGSAARCHSILLVDDLDEAREVLSMLLEALGHKVVAVADGENGLKAAASMPFDLAILDIGLPGMDGYELARRLREDPATSAIKLFALTGYGMQDDKDKAAAAGFDCHLTKPLQLDALARCLEAVFD